ncbi:cytidylyltransferase domain-containing protein [Lysinibacillus sp. NPDC094403]|uniref:acylneuraminate cytidylyltransferase family protein n=1 Tax=Lysinibacillus sp. NPDC094403 TaxID=3390581 RepID=UPI003D028886
MYKGKTVLGIIPARGGSKGIPYKNILEIIDKPLIAYTIESALASKYLDEVIVSTDCKKIAEVSIRYGAKIPFLRPKHLATDKAKTIDAILHTINKLEENFDYIVLLQPTQPLRKTRHIDEAIEIIIDNSYKSLLSVTKVNEHPILMRTIEEDNKLVPIINVNSTVRRQDFKDVFIVDGSIYINDSKTLSPTTSLNDNEYAYVMDEIVIDIDDYSDVQKLKEILKKENNKKK